MKYLLNLLLLHSVFFLTACDRTAPLIVEITPVSAVTHNPSPSYSFSSDDAGKITYIGDCKSASDTAISGINTLKFNALSVGIHSNCKIVVEDLKGNQSLMLAVTNFEYMPILIKEVKPVSKVVVSIEPEYSFSSNSAGTIIVGGACKSSDTKAVLGENIIKFSQLTDDLEYTDCTITVQDAEGMVSSPLTVNSFLVDKFTKLDKKGKTLPSKATDWSCVRDNETKLLWEEKTSDNGLHHSQWGYSWFNPAKKTNGGFEGYQHQNDMCFKKKRCDTFKFIEDVNKTRLCGRKNWYLPSKDQLKTLMTCSKANCEGVLPHLNESYFSHPEYYYWSSTPDSDDKELAWAVDYGKGGSMTYAKSRSINVRLVNGK